MGRICPVGAKRISCGWEIDHEKPQQDILIEIPESSIKSSNEATMPHR